MSFEDNELIRIRKNNKINECKEELIFFIIEKIENIEEDLHECADEYKDYYIENLKLEIKVWKELMTKIRGIKWK